MPPGQLALALDPAGVASLRRHAGLSAAGRSTPVHVVWHDTADAALARDGLLLSCTAGQWRLERTEPGARATPPVLLAEAASLALLGHGMPPGLGPVATLDATRHQLSHGSVAIEVLHGPAEARLHLEGPADEVAAAARLLAQSGAFVPRGRAGHEPRLGAPEVAEGQTVGTALAGIVAHLVAVMLHWTDRITGDTPEPVHQARVAARRLRSALSLFKRDATWSGQVAASDALRHCAARLGAARDWDVFLGGTGAQLAEAFPDEPRCAALLRAATRRRRAAYAELRQYLEGSEFRELGVTLAGAAALHPWDSPAIHDPAPVFAAAALARRHRHVRRAGRGIETLPTAALHELRKDCKRLRYAAEFFAGLFPGRTTRRYVKRLAQLQEELGLLNDGAAVSGLMAQLGSRERGFGAGLVEGFCAAHAAPARARILRTWRRFRAAPPFWPA